MAAVVGNAGWQRGGVLLVSLAALALSACQQNGAPGFAPPPRAEAGHAAGTPDLTEPNPAVPETQGTPVVPDQQVLPAQAPPPQAPSPQAHAAPIAAELTRLEWRKAENRAHCAPIVLTSSGGAAVSARRADFYGGWAVAFDLPGRRSAYGVAGVGLLAADNDPIAEKEQSLRHQWPYFRMLPGLGQPAFAGYGVEGAKGYPADNPEGTAMDSLAYVRVDGQKCLYNVWSKLGRKHLETLLDSLRVL